MLSKVSKNKSMIHKLKCLFKIQNNLLFHYIFRPQTVTFCFKCENNLKDRILQTKSRNSEKVDTTVLHRKCLTFSSLHSNLNIVQYLT